MITDIIVGLIILLIVAGAVAYIIRAKKRGARCVGCPDAGCCSPKKEQDHLGCGCGCHSSK